MKTCKIMILWLVVGFSLFPDLSRAEENQTDKAWQALVDNDFESADRISEECIVKLKDQALRQQNEVRTKKLQKGLIRNSQARSIKAAVFKINALTAQGAENEGILPQETVSDTIVSVGYKELNDVGTAQFIQAEALKAQGCRNEAKQKYQKVVESYPDAYCHDPRGWFWNVASVAQDRIDLMDTTYDYEDYKSETLVKKAWQALKDNDGKGMELYAKKSIQLYEQEAQNTQNQITGFASKEEAFNLWELNDVAISYFILGEKYFNEGDEDEAIKMYQKATEYGFAQCWDPKGWFWKVKEVSQDKLDTMGTPYDFSDYKSVNLTKKAWDALSEGDFKGVELYAKKCIYLYEQKAIELQQELNGFAIGGFIPYYWALNDVGTCYFILGQAYQQQNDPAKAKNMYQAVVQQLRFAQCWDPRGWYWKVADVSKKRLDELH